MLSGMGATSTSIGLAGGNPGRELIDSEALNQKRMNSLRCQVVSSAVEVAIFLSPPPNTTLFVLSGITPLLLYCPDKLPCSRDSTRQRQVVRDLL